ncbi:MAG: hypothetical protein LV479_04190 [Methylacidiphilales bacterium]|nr:hypothetical protein [Candidatus Methylacidiphilales bacterium]
MPETMVNVHAAKTQLSRLIALAEKGQCIMIARAGKPVAQLGPVRKARPSPIPQDDPLLNLTTFAVKGPTGKLTNPDIDRILYGGS